MRIKSNYKLRQIAGENLVVMTGKEGTDMTRVISLSNSAAWLWKQLEGKKFTETDAVELLVQEYEVDKQTAIDAVKWWVDALIKNRIAE